MFFFLSLFFILACFFVCCLSLSSTYMTCLLCLSVFVMRCVYVHLFCDRLLTRVPPAFPHQEYKQLDLMAYANKIAGDVERLTSKSSLGRLGSSASPLLPATTAMGGGGGEVFLASLDHQNANNINNNINHGRHQEGWGRAMNGGRGGGGGGERTEDTLEVEVDEPQRVWRGGREDDIIG